MPPYPGPTRGFLHSFPRSPVGTYPDFRNNRSTISVPQTHMTRVSLRFTPVDESRGFRRAGFYTPPCLLPTLRRHMKCRPTPGPTRAFCTHSHGPPWERTRDFRNNRSTISVPQTHMTRVSLRFTPVDESRGFRRAGFYTPPCLLPTLRRHMKCRPTPGPTRGFLHSLPRSPVGTHPVNDEHPSSDKTFRFPPRTGKLGLQVFFMCQVTLIIEIFRPNRTLLDACAAFNANACDL